jgi:preprotein translocase subunit SecA
LKEGEVIQHSMVTKSIERAQKKVEENNFGIRKRLLEYDNVMNSQREVIYTAQKECVVRRTPGARHFHYAVRYLSEDIAVTVPRILNDYDSMRLNALSTLGVDFEITEEEFRKGDDGSTEGSYMKKH